MPGIEHKPLSRQFIAALLERSCLILPGYFYEDKNYGRHQVCVRDMGKFEEDQTIYSFFREGLFLVSWPVYPVLEQVCTERGWNFSVGRQSRVGTFTSIWELCDEGGKLLSWHSKTIPENEMWERLWCLEYTVSGRAGVES